LEEGSVSQARTNVSAHRRPSRVHRLLFVSILALAICSGAAPQESKPSDEIRAHVTTPAYELHVESNLVDVRVVVRDPEGKTVSGLHKEDFRLFDNGRPQEISRFTTDLTNTKAAAPIAPSGATEPGVTAVLPAVAAMIPQRFVALYFDDLHTTLEEVQRTRDAAWKYVSTTIQPDDRVAIFTTSGENQIDFTDDRAKLHDALYRLAPRSRTLPTSTDCPEIEEYQAYLIDQRQDAYATEIAVGEAYYCDCIVMDNRTPECKEEATRRTKVQAAQIWDLANMQVQYSLQGIENAVRRLAAMAGWRSLVLISPGFLTETRGSEVDAITAQALRQNVIISAIDAAGLYARVPHRLMNLSRLDLESHKDVLEHTAETASRNVLASLTSGTGGVFFHNSNDFGDGFRQTAEIPEVSYVLSFSPENVKMDGKLHSLKVTLAHRGNLSVEARRGYFASSATLADNAPSRDELERVVFSQEELHVLPVVVTAKVVKRAGQEATLEVLIHVDPRLLPFRKEADRSVDTLIFDTAIFDHDGKYVAGKEGSLELHLKDATLQKVFQTGINANTSFLLVPGTYRVREVVRDTESKRTTAVNYLAQVPL
jgi:VWFA-related protein